jgi:hypothetical protein
MPIVNEGREILIAKCELEFMNLNELDYIKQLYQATASDELKLIKNRKTINRTTDNH